MKRAFLIIFLILPVILIAGVVIFLAVGLEPTINHFKPEIETGISHLLEKETNINGKIDISFFPQFEITAQNLAVRTAKKPYLNAERLKVSFDFRPWPKDTLVISNVTLTQPSLKIRQGLKETYVVPQKNEVTQPFYYETITKLGLILFAGVNRQLPGRMTRLKALIIKEFIVEQGGFLLSEKTGKRILKIDTIQLVLQGLYARKLTDLKQGWQTILKKHSLTGQASAKSVHWDKLHFKNLRFQAKNQEGRISFSQIKTQSIIGEASGQLIIDTRLPDISYEVALKLKAVKLGQLLNTFKPKVKAMGDLEAELKATSQGKTLKTLLKKLNGDLELKGKTLTLSELDIDAMLENYRKSQSLDIFDIGAFIVFGPLGLLASKSIDVTSIAGHSGAKKKSSIPNLQFDWMIKRGVAQTKDVAFATRKYRVAAKGKLDLNKLQYENIQIALLNKKGCIEFSQILNGPLKDPEINSMSFVGKVLVSPLTSIAKGISSVFSDSCDVFYKGTVPHPKP